MEIKKKLSEAEQSNLLVFKKETSEKNKSLLKSHLGQENFKIACLCSFSYLIGSRMSDLLLDVYESNSKVSIIIEEGESMLNTLVKETSISRCIDRTFGTKVKGNLCTALDRSTNTLSNPDNEDVDSTNNHFIFGIIRAEPGPYNTYELFEFIDFPRINEPCLKIKIDTGASFYEDFTVFKEIDSIDIILKSETYNICKVVKPPYSSNGRFEIEFNDRLFDVIEKTRDFEYVAFYTLIALIDQIIRCNSIYIKFACAISPIDGSKVLSYKEASSTYADYKSARATDRKERLANYLSHKEVNPLYEIKLCFNKLNR